MYAKYGFLWVAGHNQIGAKSYYALAQNQTSGHAEGALDHLDDASSLPWYGGSNEPGPYVPLISFSNWARKS